MGHQHWGHGMTSQDKGAPGEEGQCPKQRPASRWPTWFVHTSLSAASFSRRPSSLLFRFFFVCLYNGEHSQSWSHYEIIGLKTPAEGWRLLSVPAAELPWELATAVRPCQLLNTWEPQLPRLFDKVIRVSPQTTDPSIKGENARWVLIVMPVERALDLVGVMLELWAQRR